ncbi:MAG: hypothetical protein HRT38_09195 [Alteromonadaceae bacterium]|nr:hypothetical protein [Alteromonadaceae bacterium]
MIIGIIDFIETSRSHFLDFRINELWFSFRNSVYDPDNSIVTVVDVICIADLEVFID